MKECVRGKRVTSIEVKISVGAISAERGRAVRQRKQ